MRRPLLIASLATAAIISSASTALADSATITAVDAGNGQMTATVSVTKTCSSGFCAWFPIVVERHSSLSCREDSAFLRFVGNLHEAAGTETASFTFRPFFLRATKLCVLIQGAPVGEAVITLPPGYGVQRSTANNCSNFGTQSAAQYYLELYPDDPSGLDADNDGQACEANKCPCGAEPISAEPAPLPPPSPPILQPPPGATSGVICAEGHHALEEAWQRVEEARRRFRSSRGTKAARKKHQALARRIREARQTEAQQIQLCGSP